MPFYPGSDSLGLVARAASTLKLTQAELADLVGCSRRTITRWFARQSLPSSREMQRIATAVYPHDPALAASIAAEGGTTLQALGLVRPEPAPAPPPTPAPPTPAPRPFPPTAVLVDAIVCAVAEAMQLPPSAVRDAVRAAFARARGLGLTVEEIDDAFSAPPPAAKPKPAARK